MNNLDILPLGLDLVKIISSFKSLLLLPVYEKEYKSS